MEGAVGSLILECDKAEVVQPGRLGEGVPIATLAREMGHESTEHTFRVYGGWCLEVGAEAAALRAAWASLKPAAEQNV